jgi:hypothetical protein
MIIYITIKITEDYTLYCKISYWTPAIKNAILYNALNKSVSFKKNIYKLVSRQAYLFASGAKSHFRGAKKVALLY